MSTSDPVKAPSTMRAAFTGKGSDILSVEGLKMMLWYISILGIPVGWLYTYRWMFRNVVLPSGTKVSFTGTVGQAYWFFLATAVLALLKRYDPTSVEFFNQGPILVWIAAVGWSFALLVGQALVYRDLYEWTCTNVAFSSGAHLTFKGRDWPYIWWTIALILSIFTIVGWAWVETAFLRWQLKNTDATGHRLTFRGGGLSLLWRTMLALVASFAILPIPWMVACLYRWVIESIDAEVVTG